MKSIKKIKVLVGLDLSEMDKALIHAIQVVRKLHPVLSFTFLHNIKLSELPEELHAKEKLDKVAEGIKAKLTKLIESEDSTFEPYKIEITLDNFSEIAFLNVHKRIDANLVILGNKQQLEGNGGLPQKIIRMLPSAVLLVPETFNPHPQKIIAAIDFSKYSTVIYQVAKQIIQENKFKELIIEPVHVVKLPWQFFPGLSESEIKQRLQDDAIEKQKKWDKNYPDLSKLNFILASEKTLLQIF